MAIPLSYNVRNVLQRPVSTITTSVGIGLTVAIFIGALALAEGFRASLVSTGRPDNALVLRKGADSEISSGIGLDAASILRSHSSVAIGPDGHPLVSTEVAAVINKPRLGQPGSSNLTIRGVDPVAVKVRGQIEIEPGGRTFTPGTDEVIVGRRVATRFANCAVGERLRIQQRDFTVVGHFSAGGSTFESEIWGDVATVAPAIDRQGGFQTVVYRMQNPADFPAVKKALESDPRLQVEVHREQEFYASQSETFTALIKGIGIFITAIMGIGAIFGAMNTMFAAVGTRKREIATLLVLGFSPFAVLTSFMIESIFLALIGGLVGCLLALPINGISTSTTNFQSFSEIGFAFRVTPALLANGLFFSLLLGIIGGFLPSLRAARQPIARTLRGG
jgi:ABC-type lipoprotein release transport system permease subunit